MHVPDTFAVRTHRNELLCMVPDVGRPMQYGSLSLIGHTARHTLCRLRTSAKSVRWPTHDTFPLLLLPGKDLKFLDCPEEIGVEEIGVVIMYVMMD